MPPFSPQQEESLVSYSVKRDDLLKDVKVAQTEKDTLLTDNKNLTESNSQLVGEIEENKQKIKDVLVESGAVVEQTKAKQKIAEAELKTINEKKDVAEEQLAATLEVFNAVASTAKALVVTLEAIKGEIVEIKTEVFNNASTIETSAKQVSLTVGELQNLVGEFYNKLVAKEVYNERREKELDTRQERLDAREAALNVTYSEVVAEMTKGGKKLSDLNKAA